jgi:hypothetical protein
VIIVFFGVDYSFKVSNTLFRDVSSFYEVLTNDSALLQTMTNEQV